MGWSVSARRGALILTLLWGTAPAQVQTATGFYYPTKEGAEILRAGFGYLALGCNGALDYSAGQYHLGKAVRTRTGDPVYAIADGVVVARNTGAWCATGDCAGLVVRHPLINGQSFQAVYGAVVSSLAPGDRVTAGNSLGVAGDTGAEDFIYLGVRLDAQPGNAPAGPLQSMSCAQFPQTNGFVDPVAWITSQRPSREGAGQQETLDQVAQRDIMARVRGDSRFVDLIAGSFGYDPVWGLNTAGGLYGLRWLDYAFTNNRAVRVFHSTVVGAPTVRYTTYFDPDTNAWAGWTLVQ